MGQSSS